MLKVGKTMCEGKSFTQQRRYVAMGHYQVLLERFHSRLTYRRLRALAEVGDSDGDSVCYACLGTGAGSEAQAEVNQAWRNVEHTIALSLRSTTYYAILHCLCLHDGTLRCKRVFYWSIRVVTLRLSKY